MEIIFYIVMLVIFFWIVGWAFNKNADKSLSFIIYSIISLGIIGCIGALILSYGKPLFVPVILLVLFYAIVLMELLIPKPAKDDRECK